MQPGGGQFHGGQYGSGVKQERLAREMPAPHQRAAVPAPASVAQPTAAAAVAAPVAPLERQQPISHEEALAAAASMKGQPGLLAASSRPSEPVTAGLRSGPGPGPEMLANRSGSPTLNQLIHLSAVTGDPIFERLARTLRR